MHWGIIPSAIKSKSMKKGHLKSPNSLFERSEKIHTSWLTESSVETKRCLIPTTVFFVWKEIDKRFYGSNESYSQRYHYLVEMIDINGGTGTMPFCFPGVYNKWDNKESKEIYDSFIIFTCETEYRHLMEHLSEGSHKNSGRIPCVIPDYQYNEWLDPTLNLDDIQAYLYPFDGEAMRAYSVTQNLSKFNVDHNVPESILFHPYTVLGDKNKYNFH